MYLLQYRYYDDHEVIGLYSSMEKVEEALEKVLKEQGYRNKDRSDFMVLPMEVDERADEWLAENL